MHVGLDLQAFGGIRQRFFLWLQGGMTAVSNAMQSYVTCVLALHNVFVLYGTDTVVN